VKIEISLFFEIFVQFSLPTLGMSRFSHFNHILLNLFDVSNAFPDNI